MDPRLAPCSEGFSRDSRLNADATRSCRSMDEPAGPAYAQMYPGNGMGSMSTPPTNQRPPMLKQVGIDQRLE